jgi:hypothetical protein
MTAILLVSKKKWKAAVLWRQSTLGGRPDRTKEEPRMTEQ